jgi:hypothetical protein
MGYEVYRVRKRFQWDGWLLAPKASGSNPDLDAIWDGLKSDTSLTAKDRADRMRQAGCMDERACNPAIYGGDVWLVQDNHPRKAQTINRRFAIYDASLPSADELLAEAKFKKLTSPPRQKVAA